MSLIIRNSGKRLKVFSQTKTNNFENISLVENNLVGTDNKELAHIFLEYFDSVVPRLHLKFKFQQN